MEKTNLEKIKISLIIVLTATISLVSYRYAQHDGYHDHGRGGYMHHYNHHGYAARPYYGVTTAPFGYGGYYYGSPNRCGYVGYWHRWRCW